MWTCTAATRSRRASPAGGCSPSPAWREAPFFDERERTALALTDAVTRLGEHGVPDDVWDAAAKVWPEKELADLSMAVATINVWNRIAVT